LLLAKRYIRRVDPLSHISLIGLVKVSTPFVAWAGFKIRESYRKRRAVGWQPTEATVYSVEAKYKDGIWTSTLSYSYSWEGEYYAGFSIKPFAKESSADEVAAKFPRGSTVTIRVNVDTPEISVLLDNDQFVKI
jgi:Protein of unknown function (DUF3592)